MNFSKGAVFPPEWAEMRDEGTGTRVVQITKHPSINHPSYFLQSSFLPGDEALFFYFLPDRQRAVVAGVAEGRRASTADGRSCDPSVFSSAA